MRLVSRLTAIVPATNEPPTLGACLEAIERAEEPPDEVIVVREPRNAGPAAARNRGAAQATGDVLVFVDADVVVHADAFRHLRATFAENGDVDAVFGSYDDAPAGTSVVSSFRNLLHHHVHQSGAGDASTFWAGLGAIRADAFRDAGGYDEDAYVAPSIEDIELGMRLTERGRRIVLDPRIQGTHLKLWTFTQMVSTDFSRRGVPWMRLLLDRGGSRALNLGWKHRLSTLAALLGAGSLLAGRLRWTIACSAVLVGLNRRLYVLLAERLGPARAVAAFPLHVAHLLTGAAAAAVAIGGHVLDRIGGERR
jgi:cellulose synthase/poly-beta-1,6-N-acetylglucosamine synthase-like glycosyltransferase